MQCMFRNWISLPRPRRRAALDDLVPVEGTEPVPCVLPAREHIVLVAKVCVLKQVEDREGGGLGVGARLDRGETGASSCRGLGVGRGRGGDTCLLGFAAGGLGGAEDGELVLAAALLATGDEERAGAKSGDNVNVGKAVARLDELQVLVC